ncbi:2Fe-2S iron-sulfur cluster-binding protein [Stakelama tenebrarum]|uniref:FAD-dependent oxidoreductase n=1 Tax=Stakelama tenebrarum TaxID=2711215 RepID=A0A6G6Y5P8_9SPHN|nr:2Fe-2S iron-sulfur cluster-binding protein [Sphingosinithalassobacter tenebrarum]QIG80171.1 FAD-dependent oxidoreductase [Sphingosinithalassobacter tenebrarum]
MSGYRIAGHPRNSARPVRFRFNGRALTGREGDTLAAALIANGVTLVGRSFKYHRPRGIIGSGFAETNALVQIGSGDRSTPNIPATQIPLEEGLEARSINCWPSVDFDFGAINDRFSRFLSAGFYYKSFVWPSWALFEPFIRRAAGLGKAPAVADPDRYDSRRAACDVLVVGGGVSGLAAARAAAETGASVLLLEAAAEPGGVGDRDAPAPDGNSLGTWIADQRAALAALNARILPRTTALGFYDHNFLTALEDSDGMPVRQRVWKIRAGRVVLACGAFERPLVFPGNDLPGVMLADSVRSYATDHGVAAGRSIAFAVRDARGAVAALATARAGAPVTAIVDLHGAASAHAESAASLGIEWVADQQLLGTVGGKRLRGVRLRSRTGGHERTIACDCLAMSGGWTPVVQLFTQSGGGLKHDPAIDTFVPARSQQAERSCGSARGLADPLECIADGEAAGRWAATGEGIQPPLSADPPLAPIDLPIGKGKAFVDFQTDVTTDDLRLAVQENYRSVEHVKRYTVWGMGVDQGRLSALNGVATLARLQGTAPGAVGTTKFRPPFAPVALGAMAAGHGLGPRFAPFKQLPAHDWHIARGAVFEDHGWLRPSHYPIGAEDRDAAARREALAVRNGVGLTDGSSFGKFELTGPQAGAFLDRLSIGSPSTMRVGKARFNLMTDELGVLFDDGVVARMDEDSWLLTASSAHAEAMLRWLTRWHQCQWPLDLTIRDVTAHWAVITLAGPRARDVLMRADCNIDFSREAFPHMAIRCGTMAGQPVRVQRVSFTGELSYEIAIAADYAASLADWLMQCGEAEGIIAFGLEALDLLRLEKGFFYIGQDTDSETRPSDIGFGKAIARKKGDFIGRRTLEHEAVRDGARGQLVGLVALDPQQTLPAGAHVIGGEAHPSQGIVTSSGFSPTLGHPIALSLLHNGKARVGEQVTIWSEGREWAARVTPPCAYDPQGERMHG